MSQLATTHEAINPTTSTANIPMAIRRMTRSIRLDRGNCGVLLASELDRLFDPVIRINVPRL
jgi:hypothetical protein